ncbi:MAG: tRNA (adenosine(37)-N6)-threonylcarbamoyltransferase complex ATPase subunit type 1 TsaE, partial [Candidatus Gracilibacteria bacterium]|nr:tRNA (adenosine(37)-N6)-threonylcarbamoyltransferase complex ATPase subunit type 1 TsaE [Candidatus Gracilibacteria bacterium]
MKKKYCIDKIDSLNFQIKAPSLIFLYGDLGAGKTTLTRHIIKNILGYAHDITSPTYTYYNEYIIENFGINKESFNVYHFDLYRLKEYDEFFAIGGEEVFDNNNGVIIVEWPELVDNYYDADIVIRLSKTDKDDEREVVIEYRLK